MPATRTIQAKPTHYAGIDFRSRLEARWAIFFDCAGVEWIYEPRWLSFPERKKDGVAAEWGLPDPYLPDFRLPDLGLWVEVRPEATLLDVAQIFMVAHAGYGAAILLTRNNLQLPDRLDDQSLIIHIAHGKEWGWCCWAECLNCNSIQLDVVIPQGEIAQPPILCCGRPPSRNTIRLRSAYQAATRTSFGGH